MSAGADKKANASRGSGALEVGDLRLVEDGNERNNALVFDAVASETASEGQDGNGEREGVSMGADMHKSEHSGASSSAGRPT